MQLGSLRFSRVCPHLLIHRADILTFPTFHSVDLFIAILFFVKFDCSSGYFLASTRSFRLKELFTVRALYNSVFVAKSCAGTFD